MATRRTFLKETTAAAALIATSISVACSAQGRKAAKGAGARITSVARREETMLRLGGHGDNFHMSWGADDRQYISVCDGFGWLDKPPGLYNSRLFSVTGGPRDATFQDVPGYPQLLPLLREDVPRYYNFGTLALDGRIYQFLSTWNHSLYRPDGSVWPELRFIGAKLIYSPDNGRTWCNQDGSTPVVWESWDHRSRDTMAFFEEDQQAFSLPSVLQMGRNYEYNRDEFVYVYAPNGNTEGTMNELVMFRVPKARVLDRSAYEYFAGRRPNGKADWAKDINARGIVHTFPRGWVNRAVHPFAWQPSVVYNAPLGLYLMTNSGMGCAPDGAWFGKPSYLGFWIAPQPWGPWTQIHEETAWTPASDATSRAYQPQIAPKWISSDGKSFWLVWTEYQITDREEFRRINEEMRRNPPVTQEEQTRVHRRIARTQPYYGFNTQRVDLVL